MPSTDLASLGFVPEASLEPVVGQNSLAKLGFFPEPAPVAAPPPPDPAALARGLRVLDTQLAPQLSNTPAPAAPPLLRDPNAELAARREQMRLMRSVSGLPEQPLTELPEHLQPGNLAAQAGFGLMQGFADLGTGGASIVQALNEPIARVGPFALSLSGVKPAGQAKDTAKFWREVAQESQARADRVETVARDIPGSEFARTLGRGAVSLVPAAAAGPLGVGAAVAASGIQQGAGTLAQAQTAYENKGVATDDETSLMPNKAFWKSAGPAAIDAVQTAAITFVAGKLFGAGAEGLTTPAKRAAIAGRVGSIVKATAGESLEEGAQQFISDGVIARLSYHPEMTLGEALKGAITAAAVGGILGGGVASFRMGLADLLKEQAERPLRKAIGEAVGTPEARAAARNKEAYAVNATLAKLGFAPTGEQDIRIAIGRDDLGRPIYAPPIPKGEPNASTQQIPVAQAGSDQAKGVPPPVVGPPGQVQVPPGAGAAGADAAARAAQAPVAPPGERLVTIQRADGTTYPAAVSDKSYNHPTRGRVPSVARLDERGQWTHGMLGADEKILPPPSTATSETGTATGALNPRGTSAEEKPPSSPVTISKPQPKGGVVPSESQKGQSGQGQEGQGLQVSPTSVAGGTPPAAPSTPKGATLRTKKAKPAPTPSTPPKEWTKIGVNADGNDVFEDAIGVRSYVEKDVRVTHPVRMVPTREGVQMEVGEPGPQFTPVVKDSLTTEPAAAKPDTVRVPQISERNSVIRKTKATYDPTVGDFVFESMVPLGAKDKLGDTLKTIDAPKEGDRVYVKDSEDQTLHGAVLLRSTPYDQLTSWEWLWLDGPSKGTTESHYGRIFYEPPSVPEPVKPAAKVTPKGATPELLDAVGNPESFYDPKKLAGAQMRRSPKLAAAMKFYGVKSVKDLNRLATRRFAEMRQRTTGNPTLAADLALLDDAIKSVREKLLNPEQFDLLKVAKSPKPLVAVRDQIRRIIDNMEAGQFATNEGWRERVLPKLEARLREIEFQLSGKPQTVTQYKEAMPAMEAARLKRERDTPGFNGLKDELANMGYSVELTDNPSIPLRFRQTGENNRVLELSELPGNAAEAVDVWLAQQGAPVAEPEPKPAVPPPPPKKPTEVPQVAPVEEKGETLADRLSGQRSATIGTVTSADGVFSMSVRPDNSAGGLSVVLSNKEGSQSIRMNYRYDMTLADMQKAFQEYLNIDNPGKFTVDISKPKPAPKEAAPLTPRQLWKRQIIVQQSIRYKTATQEKNIERLKAKLAVDPSKWSVGDGVGYRVNSGRGTQVNRGFRIVDVDADAETVTVRQVADTGLTSSGGDQDRIGDVVIDMVDLVRDNKYTRTPAAAAKPEPTPTAAVPKPQPMNMAGQVREKRAPFAGPPAFETLHPKSQEKFNSAWEAKDAEAMKELLHLQNKGLRGEFSKRVGLKLPNTEGGTRMAINSWARGTFDKTESVPKEAPPVAPVEERKSKAALIDELLGPKPPQSVANAEARVRWDKDAKELSKRTRDELETIARDKQISATRESELADTTAEIIPEIDAAGKAAGQMWRTALRAKADAEGVRFPTASGMSRGDVVYYVSRAIAEKRRAEPKVNKVEPPTTAPANGTAPEIPKVKQGETETRKVLTAGNVETTADVQGAQASKPLGTGGAFSGKVAREQKKFLLDAVDQAIAEAPDRLPAKVEADADFDVIDDLRVYKAGDTKTTFEARREEQLTSLFEKYDIPTRSPSYPEVRSLDPSEPQSKASPSIQYSFDTRFALLERDIVAARFQQREKVKIEVPGDGDFDIINTKSALRDFRERAAKFPTTAGKLKGSTQTRTGPTPATPLGKPDKESAVKALAPVTSEDEGRKIIHNIWSDGKESVATNGRMLTLVRVGLGGTKAKPIVVTREGKPVTLEKDEKFPDWTQAVPKETKESMPNVDTEKLFTILRQAQEATSEKSVSVKLWRNKDGSLGVTANAPEVASYSHNVHTPPVEGELREPGPDTSRVMMAIDPKYLIDAINAARRVGDKTVTLKWTDELSPLIVESKTTMSVIMPMRLSFERTVPAGVASDTRYGEVLRSDPTVDAVLDALEANANPFEMALIAKLRSLGLRTGFRLAPRGEQPNPRTWGLYDSDTDTITLFEGSPDQHGDLFHELLHPATIEALTQNPEFRAEIEAMLEEARAALGTGYYGTRNVYEFLAEAFKTGEFQARLMDVRKGPGKQNLWQRFLGWLRKVLGLKPADASLLERVIRRATPEFRAPGKEVVVASNAIVAAQPGMVSIGPRAPLPAITAYHGTPHKVDKFSTEKIGSGEGAQVYGYGLYFAENPAVADEYQKSLAGLYNTDARSPEGKRLPLWVYRNLDNGNVAQIKADFQQRYRDAIAADNAVQIQGTKEVIEGIEAWENGTPFSSGNKYTVSLKPEADELLDWDKPLSEQPKIWKKLNRQRETKEGGKWFGSNTGSQTYDRIKLNIRESSVSPDKRTAMDYRTEAPKAASEYLARLGIKGIRYLDQGSRKSNASIFKDGQQWAVTFNDTANNAAVTTRHFPSESAARSFLNSLPETYNYVIFNDADIQITHENGQRVSIAEAQAEQQPNETPGQPPRIFPMEREAAPEGERTQKPAEPGKTKTQVVGDKFTVEGKPGMASREDLESHAAEVFRQAGFRDVERREFTTKNGAIQSIFWLPRTGFNMDAEGNALAELLQADLGRQRTPEEKPLGMLLNSIREAWKSPQSVLMDMSPGVRDRLLQLAQSEASERGAKLGELSMFSADMSEVALHADIYLTRHYADLFGGDKLHQYLARILTEFRSLFGEKEWADVLETSKGKELGPLIEELARLNVRDSGGRVYRSVHAMFKPKRPKTEATKERIAREDEAINAMIEQAVKLKIAEPKPLPGQKLTPEKRLLLMTTPQTQAKIQQAVETAIRTAERNAGLAAMRKTEGTEDEVAAIMADADAMPEADFIEQGLSLPEFAHWRKFRDNLLGYSPTTAKLVQDVIRGNFKGVRFKAAEPKPEDLRVDMRKLAQSPEAEVQRAFDAQLQAASDIMDMANAAPAVKERVIQAIRDNLNEQLEARRQEFRSKMFSDPAQPGQKLTPEQQLGRQINAGLFRDERLAGEMVERVAGKAVVQNLVPKMGDLVKQVLDTPFYRQDELKQRFADALARQIGIDPAQVDKAWTVFQAAFSLKMAEARKRAFKKLTDSLTLKEKKAFGERKLWLEIEHLANAGYLDDASHLRAIANSRLHRPPDDSKVRQMRDWAEQEMRLRELTGDEESAIRNQPGKSPEEIESELMMARDLRGNENTEARRELMQKMAARWSQWTAPTSDLKHIWTWFHDDFRENNARAVNEFVSANYLAKIFFGTRIAGDVVTGGALGGLTRELAHGWERWANDAGNPNRDRELVKDLQEAVADGFKHRRQFFGLAFLGTARTLKTGVKARTVELMEKHVLLFDRAQLRADELAAEGKQMQALFTRIFAAVEFGRRIAGAGDVLQSIPTEALEIRLALTTEIRSKFPGITRGEAQIKADQILGDIPALKLEVINSAKAKLEAGGVVNPTTMQVSINAWRALRERMLQAMERAHLMPDNFREELEQLRESTSWNLPEEGGPGALIGIPMRKGLDIGAKMGIPLGPFLSFGNSIAISANNAFAWLGGGVVPRLFKGSSFAEGEISQRQMRVKGVLGGTISGLVFMLIAAGLIAFRRKWPDDEKERERWVANGWQPNQFEIPLGDNQSFRVSGNTWLGAFFRPAAHAGAAVRELLEDQQQRQEKLNREAEKLGIAPGKAEGPSATQIMGVFGSALWGGMGGSRTAGGALSKYTDYGTPDAKKVIAGAISGVTPFAPAWQEVARALGSNVNPKMASIRELVIPIPATGSQRLNVLGDPLRNASDAERIIGIATGGTVPWPVETERNKTIAYSNYFASDYHAPAIAAAKGYNVNGEYRPLSSSELQAYAARRGRYFQEELSQFDVSGMSQDDARTAVQSAFRRANDRALAAVGVTVPASASRSRAGESTSGSQTLAVGAATAQGGGVPRLTSRLGPARGTATLRFTRRPSGRVRMTARRGSLRFRKAPRVRRTRTLRLPTSSRTLRLRRSSLR